MTRRFLTYIMYGSLLGNILRVRPLDNLKDDPVFIFISPHTLILRLSCASDNRKDSLTLLDDKDDMSPEDEAVGMFLTDGFRLHQSRPAALDSFLVKRGVLVRLSMGLFGGLITRKSQERTN